MEEGYINCELRISNYELRMTDYGSVAYIPRTRGTKYELRNTNFKLRLWERRYCQLSITKVQLQIINRSSNLDYYPNTSILSKLVFCMDY